MTQKRLIIIATVLTGLFFIYKLADIFAPGSYPYAEHYELNYPEDKVIEAIIKLKTSDSKLLVPKVTIQGGGQLDLNDGKEKETDHWYKFYFYNKEKNEILFTWTRPAGKNTTTFAFVSINEGLDIGHWKNINDDFGFFENKKIKKHFEETILEKIKGNLNNNN
jgi:hypothetical protein